MNLPGINWSSGSIKSSCPSPSQHSQFLDILADYGLVQITDKLTREENVLDLILVNNPSLLKRLEVVPGISDHDVVFAEIDISQKKTQASQAQGPNIQEG